MKKLYVEQTLNKIGQEVELFGWVDSKEGTQENCFYRSARPDGHGPGGRWRKL